MTPRPALRSLFFATLIAAPAGVAAQQPPAAPSVNYDSLPVAPDSVALARLVNIRAVDSTIRVDARYSGSNNFTGAPLPGYEANAAWLRREAAEALARVQKRLATGDLGLKVWDGYRPRQATLAMVDWCVRTGNTSLLDEGYIARRSRHNLGLAVDLTLVDLARGTELPMGTAFDTFSDSAHTANAEGRVRSYRQILVRAMEAEGFKNYDQEWWHFSFEAPDPQPYDVPVR
jgi:D-alanyl-D-alanine dipeptidase